MRTTERSVEESLPAAASQQHHRHRATHDLQVLECRLSPDVVEVVGDLAADVVHRGIVSLVDLRQAGDPGPHALAPLVALDLLPQVYENGGLFGPRADDVHIPP